MTNLRVTDEDVYRKYADELVRFAMGLVGRDDAPDVVSEATLRVLSSESWSTVGDQRAYLYRAVFHQAANTHRERQRRWRREMKAASNGAVDMPEYRPEVLAAVKQLSLRQRAVVVLTYWDQMTAPEIAHQLGISEGSVHRHLARARSKLRGVLHE